jgi:tRNA pseudouridine38-40 synthase
LRAWQLGTNTLTPAGVKVLWARQVADDFHARYSATARRYQYLWYAESVQRPLLSGRATPTLPLDASLMHRAAQGFLGEQDFSSVRAAGCQAPHPFRRVDRIRVEQFGRFVVLDVTANAFLLHMVRNMAAALHAVGRAARPESWIGELLAARDRSLLGPTAPPGGLYLVDVRYPHVTLPRGQVAPPLEAVATLDRL